jgi:DNA gyrase/topoisomerase IV subunit A
MAVRKKKDSTIVKGLNLIKSGEADALISAPPAKKEGMRCTLVYTADEKLKVLVGKNADALEKTLDGKFKPHVLPLLHLETKTDQRIFAFTNYGNCHKLDISEEDLQCKLTDEGVTLKDLSEDAETGEKIIAMMPVGEHLPYGSLLFFTAKGMIKKSLWEEYEQRKQSFQAVKLGEDDEVIGVEEDRGEEETILIVTKGGICLNAEKSDIPTQGRIAAGVRGIMLHDSDEVVLMTQIDGDGEVVIATDEGKFKRVISSLIEPSKRYRKGSLIVSLRDGASVICASYVKEPYMLAVIEKGNVVSELSSEDVFILMQSSKAKKVDKYAEENVKAVIPMPYKLV